MSSIEYFYTVVESCLGGGTPPGILARDEAGRTVHAVLAALEPRDLGRSLNDVVAEVARSLSIDEETAERRLSCVMCALRELVANGGCVDEMLAG